MFGPLSQHNQASKAPILCVFFPLKPRRIVKIAAKNWLFVSESRIAVFFERYRLVANWRHVQVKSIDLAYRLRHQRVRRPGLMSGGDPIEPWSMGSTYPRALVQICGSSTMTGS